VGLRKRQTNYARNHYIAMHGLQEPELHHHEESEEAHRAHGDKKVLQHVPEADAAQGSKIKQQRRVFLPAAPVWASGE
jgi:hypothetical protein